METFNPYDSHKRHAYEVEIERNGKIEFVKVFANNRNEAVHIVATFGFVARSIGMMG